MAERSFKDAKVPPLDLHALPPPDGIFQLLSQVGTGTYGEVYKARHIKTGQMTGVKVLELIPDEEEEIKVEVEVLRKAQHPNIPKFFGAFLQKSTQAGKDDKLWLAMEFCGGGSITDLAKRAKVLPEPAVTFVLLETMRALKYLHDNDVIHRDLKGQNILLAENGAVRLIDFGVSAQMRDAFAKRNTFIGTPYWMAPEVIASEHQPDSLYDTRSDVWSLGITAIEICETEPPLSDLHPMRALHMIPRNPPPGLQNPKRWSAALVGFIAACLVKDPEARPTCAALLKHAAFAGVNPRKGQALVLELLEKHRKDGGAAAAAAAAASGGHGDGEDEDGLPMGPRGDDDGDGDGDDTLGPDNKMQSLHSLASTAGFVPGTPVAATPAAATSAAAKPAPATPVAPKAPAPAPKAPSPDTGEFGFGKAAAFDDDDDDPGAAGGVRGGMAGMAASSHSFPVFGGGLSGKLGSPRPVSSPPPAVAAASAAAAAKSPAPAAAKSPAPTAAAKSPPTAPAEAADPDFPLPEVRKFRKTFGAEVLAAAAWGPNLLVGTKNGLLLLDRDDDGRVYPLISRRRFTQLETIDSLGVVVTRSGKYDKLRMYNLVAFKHYILRIPNKDVWFQTIGNLDHVTTFQITCYESMKFLAVAMPQRIVLFLWAPKPYYKFMLYKEFSVPFEPTKLDLAVSDGGDTLQLAFASASGFHQLDIASGAVLNLFIPRAMPRGGITPVAIVRVPGASSGNGTRVLVYDDVAVAVDRRGDVMEQVQLTWNGRPSSAAMVVPQGHLLGWTETAIEFRDPETGRLRGVFRHKRSSRLNYLCTQGNRVYFASTRSSSDSQVYFMVF